MRARPLFPLLFVLSTSLSVGGCLTETPRPAATATLVRAQPKSPPLDLARLEAALHAEINAARQRNGLRPLSHTARLAEIARSHSAEMAAYNYFDHIDRRGERPRHRAKRAGIRCRMGENLFYTFQYASYQTTIHGTRSETLYDWKSEQEIAGEAVEGWLRSPAHRDALLSENYQVHGIGAVMSDGLKIFVTQNLC